MDESKSLESLRIQAERSENDVCDQIKKDAFTFCKISSSSRLVSSGYSFTSRPFQD